VAHEPIEPGAVSDLGICLDALIELAFHRGFQAALEDEGVGEEEVNRYQDAYATGFAEGKLDAQRLADADAEPEFEDNLCEAAGPDHTWEDCPARKTRERERRGPEAPENALPLAALD